MKKKLLLANFSDYVRDRFSPLAGHYCTKQKEELQIQE